MSKLLIAHKKDLGRTFVKFRHIKLLLIFHLKKSILISANVKSTFFVIHKCD